MTAKDDAKAPARTDDTPPPEAAHAAPEAPQDDSSAKLIITLLAVSLVAGGALSLGYSVTKDRIAAADDAAKAAGIVSGLTLADARALLPDLAVVEADAAADRRARAALADWCGRYTPWTAVDE